MLTHITGEFEYTFNYGHRDKEFSKTMANTYLGMRHIHCVIHGLVNSELGLVICEFIFKSRTNTVLWAIFKLATKNI